MHRAAAALVIGLLLGAAGPSVAPAEKAPAAGDAAMAFVAGFSDDHLSGMLSRVGGQSEAMRTLSRIDAPLLAAAFDAEIDAAVERHGDAWARNLALAWSPLLSDAEMRSLAEEGAGSPYTAKYVAARDEAAAAMAGLSQDLFRDILSEVIGRTLRGVSGQTPPPE